MTLATVPASISDAVVLGDPQLRTEGELLALAFAADGTLWSVEEPGLVRHWNSVTGQELTWQSLSDFETLWCFSKDARLLASAGTDDLSVWDTNTGDLRLALGQRSAVTALCFADDATLLATGHEDGATRIWDISAGRLRAELRSHAQAISAVALDAGGKRLASACEARIIGLWDLDQARQVGTLEGHADRIPALVWHPDGRTLISAGWDSAARLWDTRTGKPLNVIGTHAGQVMALALSPDGQLLACADANDAIHLWNMPRCELHTILKGSARGIACLAFDGEGRRLASAGADRVIHVWDARHGQPLSNQTPRTPARTALALSVDGMRLATNGGGATVRMWSTSVRQPVLQFLDEPRPVHALAYSPDGRWLAGGTDTHIRLWDAVNGRPFRLLEELDEPCTALAFAPDSAILASASSAGTAVWLWRLADGEPILIIPDALDGCAIETLAFHPKGNLLAVGGIDWLATGGSDGAICLWDVQQRCEIALFAVGTTSFAFHPLGRRLAAATLAHTIAIWDIQTEQLLHELSGHEETVNCVAYRADGQLIASGSDDRTVRLWNSRTGALAGVRHLDSQVKSLCFAPDGRYLYTGNGNTTCCQLDMRELVG